MKTAWAVVFGLVIGLLVGGLVWLAASPPRGEPIELIPPPSPVPWAVYVVGAVSHPGVVNIPPGSRVEHAVQAAGGLLPQADQQVINLAAPLQDGERVVIPTRHPEQTPASASQALAPTGQRSNPLPETPSLIDLNTATLVELESLPEIGPVTAQKIIDYRTEHGAFKTIEGILDVPGIGPKTFDQIKDLITVGNLP